MTISKAKAVGTVPFEGKAATVVASGGSPKSLTVKLEADTYAALRAYCYEQERAHGSRLTHQQVMVEALTAFLASKA